MNHLFNHWLDKWSCRLWQGLCCWTVCEMGMSPFIDDILEVNVSDTLKRTFLFKPEIGLPSHKEGTTLYARLGTHWLQGIHIPKTFAFIRKQMPITSRQCLKVDFNQVRLLWTFRKKVTAARRWAEANFNRVFMILDPELPRELLKNVLMPGSPTPDNLILMDMIWVWVLEVPHVWTFGSGLGHYLGCRTP